MSRLSDNLYQWLSTKRWIVKEGSFVVFTICPYLPRGHSWFLLLWRVLHLPTLLPADPTGSSFVWLFLSILSSCWARPRCRIVRLWPFSLLMSSLRLYIALGKDLRFICFRRLIRIVVLFNLFKLMGGGEYKVRDRINVKVQIVRGEKVSMIQMVKSQYIRFFKREKSSIKFIDA